MKEAKWNNLDGTTKRRFLDATTDRDTTVAYAVTRKSDFERMTDGYALYDESRMTTRPTCFATAAMYTALLLSLDDDVTQFEFDKVWSDEISATVVTLLDEMGVGVSADPVISGQSKGVQAADCAAGAAREHAKDGTWPSISEQWHDETDYVLSTVEHWLGEYRVT